MTVCQRLARYAVAQRTSPLSETQRAALRRVLMDWLGCALGGSREPIVEILRLDLPEKGRATLLLDAREVGVRAAAMVNAVAAHALELDDIFKDGLYHPGAPVIAAALALAEQRGATVDELLCSILIGYEISTRIAAVINPAHYRYWHTTGTVGCIGAAAACATLLECDETRFAHALATATTFASGLQQAFRSAAMTKPLHAGHAAETGVWTALAAMRGATGALDILEGEAGFGAAMGASPDWQSLLEGLGERDNVVDTTFKRHACCGQTFSAVDAVLALRERLGPVVDRIDRIDVFTNQATLTMTADATPTDPLAARFSMPYVLATALCHGDVGLQAFEAPRLVDPATRELMTRVHLHLDPAIDATFPAKRSARVGVRLQDGQVLEHFQPHRKGDPEEPLSDAELEAKFLEAAMRSVSVDVANALLGRLRYLNGTAPVAALLASLR